MKQIRKEIKHCKNLIIELNNFITNNSLEGLVETDNQNELQEKKIELAKIRERLNRHISIRDRGSIVYTRKNK